MARYFVDTSALVKRYHAEQGTDVVDGLFVEPQATRLVSRLGVVETISAFAMKVRTGEIAEADFHVVRSRFLADMASHVVLVVRLLVMHFREADRLLQRHATSKRLRTRDALQLSVARYLKTPIRRSSMRPNQVLRLSDRRNRTALLPRLCKSDEAPERRDGVRLTRPLTQTTGVVRAS